MFRKCSCVLNPQFFIFGFGSLSMSALSQGIPFQIIKHTVCKEVVLPESRRRGRGWPQIHRCYTDAPSKPLLQEKKGEKMIFPHHNMTTLCQKCSWQHDKLMKSGYMEMEGLLDHWKYSVFVIAPVNETLTCFFLLFGCMCAHMHQFYKCFVPKHNLFQTEYIIK